MAASTPSKRRAKAAAAQPTRIAPDMYAAAQQAAPAESRSAAQQIDFWLRVGHGVSQQRSASRRRIDAVLAGTLPLTALRAEERLVVNAELDASIDVRAAATPLGVASTRQGRTTVALDEQGRLVEYRPDGTSTVLDKIQAGPTADA